MLLASGGLIVSNQLISFVGFVVIVAAMSAVGYPRLMNAGSLSEAFKVLLVVGATGLCGLTAWVALTFSIVSAVAGVVLTLIWVLVFGGSLIVTNRRASNAER